MPFDSIVSCFEQSFRAISKEHMPAYVLGPHNFDMMSARSEYSEVTNSLCRALLLHMHDKVASLSTNMPELLQQTLMAREMSEFLTSVHADVPKEITLFVEEFRPARRERH